MRLDIYTHDGEMEHNEFTVSVHSVDFDLIANLTILMNLERDSCFLDPFEFKVGVDFILVLNVFFYNSFSFGKVFTDFAGCYKLFLLLSNTTFKQLILLFKFIECYSS